MANRHRGEIAAVLDGKTYTLRLTLNALAELEEVLGEDPTATLARWSDRKLTMREAIAVIGAGLRGGGTEITDEEVGRMQVEKAWLGAGLIVERLFVASYGGDEGAKKDGAPEQEPTASPGADTSNSSAAISTTAPTQFGA